MRSVVGIGVAIVVAMGVADAKASTIIDDFDSGSVGSGLHGRVAPVGGAIWYSGQGYWQSSTPGGGIQIDNSDTLVPGAPVSRLASVFVTPMDTNIFTVDVKPPTAVAGWWGAITLVNNVSTHDSALWNVGKLTLLLDNQGLWTLYGQNTTQLTSGSLAGFNSSVLHTMRLAYDVQTNQASASIDGLPLVSSFGLGSYTPDFDHAAMQMYGPGGTFDNFNFTSVPEPASVVGIAALSGMLLKRQGRKRGHVDVSAI